MNYSDPFGLAGCELGKDCWAAFVKLMKEVHAVMQSKDSPARMFNPAMLETAGLIGRAARAEAGATAAVVGASETRVSRWMSEAEYKAMKASGTLQTNGRTFVTTPGAPKPGGTGPVRVDFNAPTDALKGAGREDWRVIYDPGRTPITGIERMTPE